LGVVLWRPVVVYDPHAGFWKELIALISNTPVSPPVYCPDAPSIMHISGGIPMYSQEAPAIIIGDVKAVGASYYKYSGVLSQQNVDIDIEEVLKGDADMKSVTIVIGGGTDMCDISFKQGEKVLLFIGKNFYGDYFTFAGPNGKYLIDQNGNVSGDGIVFPIPLADVKAGISDAMKAPPMLKHNPPVPYTGEGHAGQTGSNPA